MPDDIVVRPTNGTALAVSADLMVERYFQIVDIKDRVMKADVHYGVIPGTDKPTLLKPGAETLCTAFGLFPDFDPLDTPDFRVFADIDPLAGVPFLIYRYRCVLSTRDGLYKVGSGIGSCNSFEKKYRYRNAQRVCPNCGKPTVIKGKAEYGGGWLCWQKAGKSDGCGSKFADDDITIAGQVTGQVPNPDIAEVINTIDKMAQKRALVAATLIAVGASDFFTQDIEDLPQFNEAPTPTVRDVAHHGDSNGQGIDDLQDLAMNTLSGEQVARVKRFSIANSGGLNEIQWLKRYKEYFQDAKINTLGLIVAEFVGTMITPTDTEDAPF